MASINIKAIFKSRHFKVLIWCLGILLTGTILAFSYSLVDYIKYSGAINPGGKQIKFNLRASIVSDTQHTTLLKNAVTHNDAPDYTDSSNIPTINDGINNSYLYRIQGEAILSQ